MTWPHQRPHVVVALALPGVVAFDLATAAQVFGFRDEAAHYSFTVCGLRPGPVPTSTGFAIDAAAGLDAVATADTVIVPGFYPPVEPDAAVCEALRSAHERGARLASVCLGAFALAAAGLLDGRRATTHWREADEFRRRYPSVWLDPDVLFVDGGSILTGAGQSGSVDFYIHVVRSTSGQASPMRWPAAWSWPPTGQATMPKTRVGMRATTTPTTSPGPSNGRSSGCTSRCR